MIARTNCSSAFISVAEKVFSQSFGSGGGGGGGSAETRVRLLQPCRRNKFISAGSDHFSCTAVLQQLIVSFSASAQSRTL